MDKIRKDYVVRDRYDYELIPMLTTNSHDWGNPTSDPISDIQEFVRRQLGEGGDMGNGQERSTLGSYAYALKCLAEGLPLAVDAGYLDADEAKREFRSKVHVVESDKQQADYVKRLEDQLAEARAQPGS